MVKLDKIQIASIVFFVILVIVGIIMFIIKRRRDKELELESYRILTPQYGSYGYRWRGGQALGGGQFPQEENQGCGGCGM
jgi:hypothetical protein